MQIVIKIPEIGYDTMSVRKRNCNTQLENMLMDIILNGTILPKGHGRLIDANKLLLKEEWYGEHATYDNPMSEGGLAIRVEDIENAPTVIEADTESEAKE